MPEIGAARSAPAAAPPLVRVAHVRRPHGVRGEVRVQALGGDARRFAPGTVLLRERDGQVLTIGAARPLDGDEVLLTFRELPTREDAAGLTGDYLCVEPSRTRHLPADEWFVWQLIGLRAVCPDGEELGLVQDVEEQPSSDVLVVAGVDGERRYPLVRQWISSVDVNGGVIVVTPWPEDEG
jgi:16S rRNA processing protein RimM